MPRRQPLAGPPPRRLFNRRDSRSQRRHPMNGSHRLNVSAGIASVSVALVLVALKAWALAATGALSVAASLADSRARPHGLGGRARRASSMPPSPPDEDHSFGHTSAEDLVALGQALLVAGVGRADRLARASHRLAAPRQLSAERAGLAVMAVSIVDHPRAGALAGPGRDDRTGSRIVAADRLHYVARPASRRSARWWRSSPRRGFGISWLDPVMALVACARPASSAPGASGSGPGTR